MPNSTDADSAEQVLNEPGAPVVVFDHVSLAFDEKVILKDISFTLIAGHTKIILGASGAGKSTILKIIVGLLRGRRRRRLGERRARRSAHRARDDARARAPRDGVPGGRALRLADGPGERRLQAVRGDRHAARRRSTRASRKCSASSAWPNSSTACRRSCPAASGAASRSRARWRRSRRFCSTTSRRPASIRSRRRRWTTRSSSCAISRTSARSS